MSGYAVMDIYRVFIFSSATKNFS